MLTGLHCISDSGTLNAVRAGQSMSGKVNIRKQGRQRPRQPHPSEQQHHTAGQQQVQQLGYGKLQDMTSPAPAPYNNTTRPVSYWYSEQVIF